MGDIYTEVTNNKLNSVSQNSINGAELAALYLVQQYTYGYSCSSTSTMPAAYACYRRIGPSYRPIGYSNADTYIRPIILRIRVH